jgi:hypothetical protein
LTTHNSQQINIHAAGGIRTRDLTGERPLGSALDGNITIAINMSHQNGMDSFTIFRHFMHPQSKYQDIAFFCLFPAFRLQDLVVQ